VIGRDLKHAALVISVAAAVAFRFFSDFSFATIEHQATLADVSFSGFSLAHLFALGLNTLRYQLQRDWFNLTPQAPAEIIGVLIAFMLAYLVLRRWLQPSTAATSVMVVAPFVGIVTTFVACAWVLARAV
jgi:putative flippase GtrA